MFLPCPEFIQLAVHKAQAEMGTWKELCMTYNATIPANCNLVHEGNISSHLKKYNNHEYFTQDTLFQVIDVDMHLMGFFTSVELKDFNNGHLILKLMEI